MNLVRRAYRTLSWSISHNLNSGVFSPLLVMSGSTQGSPPSFVVATLNSLATGSNFGPSLLSRTTLRLALRCPIIVGNDVSDHRNTIPMNSEQGSLRCTLYTPIFGLRQDFALLSHSDIPVAFRSDFRSEIWSGPLEPVLISFMRSYVIRGNVLMTRVHFFITSSDLSNYSRPTP